MGLDRETDKYIDGQQNVLIRVPFFYFWGMESWKWLSCTGYSTEDYQVKLFESVRECVICTMWVEVLYLEKVRSIEVPLLIVCSAG